MKKTRAAALLLLAALLPPAAGGGAAGAGDGLWQKALEVYRRNRDWYPQKVAILSEVLNRRGEPSSVTEMLFRLRLDGRGRVQAELQHARRNGEDTTAKVRSKVVIRSPEEGIGLADNNAYSVSLSDSPFDPDRQRAVALAAGGERRWLFGRWCRRYNFSYRTRIVRKGSPEELTWRGMAWLAEGSGVPVKLEFGLDPLPGPIRSLWTIYFYDTARPDRWVLKKVSMAGSGGFLFIKKRFRTTTTFDDYRLAPAGNMRRSPAAVP